MKYIKVKFTGDVDIDAYQVVDDAITCVIKYINLDGTNIDLSDKNYCCNVINETVFSLEDILPGLVWHEAAMPICVKINYYDELHMLYDNPEMGIYRQDTGIITHIENDYTYNYTTGLTPTVISVLEQYNAQIIEK